MTSRSMNPPPRSFLAGRPPKRKRSDAELQDLARVLGADWTQGDAVQTWIHKHEGRTGELSRLVEDGWLWEDIGKAMHLAGITYRTGQQIPPHTLRLKAHLSRNRERDRAATKAARQIHTTAAAAQTGMPGDMAGEAGGSAPEDPTFRLVSLKGDQQPPKPPLSPNTLPQEPSMATKISDDEILRRVFGKS
jgi:hypothetical protein